MKFSHIIISFAALNGAASSVYAKETSEASSVVGDGHISPFGSDEPLRGQLVEVDTSAKEPDDTRRKLAKAGKGKGKGKRRQLKKAQSLPSAKALKPEPSAKASTAANTKKERTAKAAKV